MSGSGQQPLYNDPSYASRGQNVDADLVAFLYPNSQIEAHATDGDRQDFDLNRALQDDLANMDQWPAVIMEQYYDDATASGTMAAVHDDTEFVNAAIENDQHSQHFPALQESHGPIVQPGLSLRGHQMTINNDRSVFHGMMTDQQDAPQAEYAREAYTELLPRAYHSLPSSPAATHLSATGQHHGFNLHQSPWQRAHIVSGTAQDHRDFSTHQGPHMRSLLPDVFPSMSAAAPHNQPNAVIQSIETPFSSNAATHQGSDLGDVLSPSVPDSSIGPAAGATRSGQRGSESRGSTRKFQCEDCVKHGNLRWYTQTNNTSDTRCRKHHLRQLKEEEATKAPEYSFDAQAVPSFQDAHEFVYPTIPPLNLDHDDWPSFQSKEMEDHWIARFIAAANTKYDVQHPTLSLANMDPEQKAMHEHLERQQWIYNHKPHENTSKDIYTNAFINVRLRFLFRAVLTHHRGGISVYPTGGANGGYGDDHKTRMSERLAQIESTLRADKRILMDVIEGRGVLAFAANPTAFRLRKQSNKVCNDRKKRKFELAERYEEEGRQKGGEGEGAEGVAARVPRPERKRGRKGRMQEGAVPGPAMVSRTTGSAAGPLVEGQALERFSPVADMGAASDDLGFGPSGEGPLL